MTQEELRGKIRYVLRSTEMIRAVNPYYSADLLKHKQVHKGEKWFVESENELIDVVLSLFLKSERYKVMTPNGEATLEQIKKVDEAYQQEVVDRCEHEIGRKVIGGIVGHPYIHPTGEQLCLKCGKTLKEIIRTAIKECFEAVAVDEKLHYQILTRENIIDSTDGARTIDDWQKKGWNDHAKAVKSAQDKFLGEEK